MVEIANIATSENETRNTNAVTGTALPHTRPEHTVIKGRFNQYVSAFWTFVLPLFTTRYLFQPLFDMMGWTDEPKSRTPGSIITERPGISPAAIDKPILQRAYALATGGVMLLATAFYSLKTLGDMRRTLRESLAYEFDKKPQDVGFKDLLFTKTDNDVVNKVRRNFFKMSARRLAFVNLPFFSFLIPGLSKRLSTENAVRWGVGLGASYLVSDVLSRRETFFEELQIVIDRKINQVGRMGEQLTATDLLNLYDINARDHSPQMTFSDKINTPLWKQNLPAFERMAALMNETYHPSNGKAAEFTIPKFVYLVGHKLIQPQYPEQTLAYVEIANRYGMSAVKKAAAAIQGGTPLDKILAQFPITTPTPLMQESQNEPKFTEKLAESRTISHPPAPSFAEKTARSDTSVAAAGL